MLNIKKSTKARLLFLLIANTLSISQNVVYADDSTANYKKWVVDAEALREQGDLISAQNKLDAALQAVENNRAEQADYGAVELANGYNLFLLNRLALAEQRIKSAQQKVSGNAYLQALADQYLANLHLAGGETNEAQSYISSGLNALPQGSHEDLRLSLELLRWPTLSQSINEKAETLLSLASRVEQLSGTSVKPKLTLKIAQLALGMENATLPLETLTHLQEVTYRMLSGVMSRAKLSGQTRLEAEALAKMAQLYRWQNRYDEALELTEQAIDLVSNANIRELLAQLEAQKGEILRHEGEIDRALSAFERAAGHLYSIRADMPISLPDGRSTLATVIDPIYRNYVDLLLQPNANQTPEQENARLIKAIDSMEAVKEADMQDFFLGRCSVGAQDNQNWQNRSFPNAAVFYPILLNDRIELVIKIDQKLTRYTIKVPVEDVQKQTLALVEALQHGKDYRFASKQLYEWLFEPVKSDLARANPAVILYVPDRSLRSIPLSALYDGKTYVVEHYGIVTLPSLELQNLLVEDKRKKQDVQALLAGLSKPDGASIDQLPHSVKEQLSDKPLPREAIVEELSLPSVEKEISTVAEKEKSHTLLNKEFTATALKSDIETGEFDKVHIASHGYFGKNARESFIMAYDQNMTLLDLKDTLEAEKLKVKPIELLTLSACKTAEGDDRMLLGFSGLAVKSNVMSAVGSLWSINDDATMEFMRLFYDGLGRSLDKAQAMREAQVAMIKNKKFRHPFFWSPFILMGKWQ